MFDIAWSEMLVIVVVALIVIGPKDLPRLVREVGRWTAKARSMAREFQRSFDDMVREAELEDIRKGIDQARPQNIAKTIRDAVDPEGDLDEAFHLDTRESGTPSPRSASNMAADVGTPQPAALPPALTDSRPGPLPELRKEAAEVGPGAAERGER